MIIKYKCSNCGKYTRRVYEATSFTCINCKTRNVVTDQTESIRSDQPQTNAVADKTEENQFAGILDGVDEASQDVKFKVEPATVDFVKTIESSNSGVAPPNLTLTQKNTVTGSTNNKLTPQTPVWEGETFSKFFAMGNEVMVSKSNAEIWDVSKKEEKKLGDLWAEVANAYVPNATAKETKLVLATAGTLAVYLVRTITFVKKYKESKRRNKGTTEQIKEPEPVSREMTDEEKIEALKNPNPDKDFADKWKSRTAN